MQLCFYQEALQKTADEFMLREKISMRESESEQHQSREKSDPEKEELLRKIEAFDHENREAAAAFIEEIKTKRIRPKEGLLFDFAKNDPEALTLVVDTELAPRSYQDFLAIHEAAELLYLLKEKQEGRELTPRAHVRATLTELEAAQRAGVLAEYEKWFEDTLSATILPRLRSALSERFHPSDVDEFMHITEETFAERQEIFQKFKQAE